MIADRRTSIQALGLGTVPDRLVSEADNRGPGISFAELVGRLLGTSSEHEAISQADHRVADEGTKRKELGDELSQATISVQLATTSPNTHADGFLSSKEIVREIPADVSTSLMDKTVLADVLHPAAYPLHQIPTDSSDVCVRFGTAVANRTHAASEELTASPTDLPVEPAIRASDSRPALSRGETIATQADADQLRNSITPAGHVATSTRSAIEPSTSPIAALSRHTRPLGVRSGPAKAVQTRLHARRGISQSAEIPLARNPVACQASGSGPSTTITPVEAAHRRASVDPGFSVDEQDDFKHGIPLLDASAIRTDARPGPTQVETPAEQTIAPIYSRNPFKPAKQDGTWQKGDGSRGGDEDSVSYLPSDETAARDTDTKADIVQTRPAPGPIRFANDERALKPENSDGQPWAANRHSDTPNAPDGPPGRGIVDANGQGQAHHGDIAFYARFSPPPARDGASPVSTQWVAADRVDLRFQSSNPAAAVPEPQVKRGREEPESSTEAFGKTGAVGDLPTPQQKRMAASEPRHSSDVFSIPQRGEDSPREPAVRTPAVSKDGSTLPSRDSALSETSQQQGPGRLPMREITLQVRGRGDARVEVTLQEQNGKVNVVVRAPDREAVVSLRAELTELARAVEDRGFRIHTWTPSDTAPGHSQPSFQAERAESQTWSEGDGRGHQNGGNDGREQRRKQAEDPEWLLELQRRLSGEEK